MNINEIEITLLWSLGLVVVSVLIGMLHGKISGDDDEGYGLFFRLLMAFIKGIIDIGILGIIFMLGDLCRFIYHSLI